MTLRIKKTDVYYKLHLILPYCNSWHIHYIIERHRKGLVAFLLAYWATPEKI